MKGKSHKTEHKRTFIISQKHISEITETKNFRCHLKNKKNEKHPTTWACAVTSDTFIVLKVPANAIRQENKTNVLRLKKEKTKLKLFADDRIIYIVNPTELTNHQNA